MYFTLKKNELLDNYNIIVYLFTVCQTGFSQSSVQTCHRGNDGIGYITFETFTNKSKCGYVLKIYKDMFFDSNREMKREKSRLIWYTD